MMPKLISTVMGLVALLAAGICSAEETAFTAGETASSEAFGSTEGVVLFIAAVLGIAGIYGMILLGRTVHKRAESEMRAVEQLLKEKH